MDRKYTLSRDLPKPEIPRFKSCRTCQQVKPNTFDHFAKKQSGSRTNYVTTDVCKACKNRNIGAGMTKSWQERR